MTETKEDQEVIEVQATPAELTVPRQSTDVAMMPVLSVEEAVRRYKLMTEFVSQLMIDGKDYGPPFPGSDKPTLLKPGGEKLATFFGLRKEFSIVNQIERWDKDDPFFHYHYRVHIFKGDTLIAEGDGSCNSLEDRYRWRWVSEDQVPNYLDRETLQTRGGKISEFKFAIDEARTEGQYSKPAEYWQQFRDAIEDGSAREIRKEARSGKVYEAWEIDAKLYRIPNADVFTQVNTIAKIAKKRAFIDGVLLAVNASEFFTQDAEDFIEGEWQTKTETKTETTENIRQQAQDANEMLYGSDQPKNNNRPYKPEKVREGMLDRVGKKFKGQRASDEQFGLAMGCLNLCFAGDQRSDDKRHSVIAYLFEVDSGNDLKGPQILALLDWLKPTKDSGDAYKPNKFSVVEAGAIVNQRMKDLGQEELFEDESEEN